MWNPDLPVTEDFRDQWQEVPDNAEFDNGVQGAVGAVPARTSSPARRSRWDLLAGARGVQLAELGLAVGAEGRRVDDPGAGTP